jgi:type I restriction enzyme S subunit
MGIMNTEIKKRIEQINKGNVPDGYKKVEMGIIPKDWDVTPLIEISKEGISNGIFNAPQKVGNGVKLVNVVNLYEEPYIKLDNLSLLDVTADELECYRVKKGDIFFTRSSLKLEGIAHCNINIFDGIDMVYDCHIMKISPDKKKFVPRFLRLFFLTSYARKYFMAHAKTTTMTTIGQKDIEKMPIYYPPLPKQQKIAKILSTCNKIIELKEKLIEQKKLQKKYLMQALLDPKSQNFRHLSGFDKDWVEIKLGECFTERRENNCTLRLLSITSEKGVIDRIEIEHKDNSNGDKSKYKVILKGDIGYNTMRMWQGVSGVSSLTGIVSPAYTVCKPKEAIYPEFFGYLFKLQKVINVFRRYSQGLVNDTLSLKYAPFTKLKFPIPQYEEQKAIANVLTIVDKEIGLLEKELEQQKLIKKALMQLLLTGKVRVNVS